MSVVLTYGEDIGSGEAARLPSWPNASAARDAFLALVTNILGTDDFESYTPQDNGPGEQTITFNGQWGAVSADYHSRIDQGCPAGETYGSDFKSVVCRTDAPHTNTAGRYPISGVNWVTAGTIDTVQLTFSEPITAFGMFTIDVGDFTGHLVVRLNTVSAGVIDVVIPNTTGESGNIGGSVGYVGIYVTTAAEAIESIQFLNDSGGIDVFAWDNFTIASAPEVSEETGTIVVVKVTLPEEDETEFDFVTVGLTPGTFSLVTGQSQNFFDVAPGDGYEVEETANADYVTTYDVSNDSPIDNISVEAGETVTITVTNSKKGTITVQKETNPPGDATEFDFVVTGATPTTFSLADGEEQVLSGIAPGTVVTVTETTVSGWTKTYIIDDDDPNDDITVTPGQIKIARVLNTLNALYSGLYFVDPNVPGGLPPIPTDTVSNPEDELEELEIPNPFIITGPIRDE